LLANAIPARVHLPYPRWLVGSLTKYRSQCDTIAIDHADTVNRAFGTIVHLACSRLFPDPVVVPTTSSKPSPTMIMPSQQPSIHLDEIPSQRPSCENPTFELIDTPHHHYDHPRVLPVNVIDTTPSVRPSAAPNKGLQMTIGGSSRFPKNR